MASASHEVVADTTDRPVPSAPGGVPPRAVRADARRNHDRLLAAAGEAFAAHGPDAALEDIARRAGVGIGTLYRHFPTRETLMAAVVRDTFEQLRARAAAGVDAADPWAALEDWMRAYLAFAATKRGLVAGIVLLKDGDDQWTGLCDRLFGSVDALLRRGQQAGVVRAGLSGRDVMHLVGSIAGSADRSEDPELPGRLLEVALAGLRTAPDDATARPGRTARRHRTV